MTIDYGAEVIQDLRDALSTALPPSKERDEINVALTMALTTMLVICSDTELRHKVEKQFKEN